MKSRKLTITLMSVAILLAISVVGITFAAVWDVTFKDNNYNINVGYGLDFRIDNQLDDGESLKDFLPVNSNDITLGVNTAKLANYFVVSTRLNEPDMIDTNLTRITVKTTYTVFAGDEDIYAYVDLYVLTGDDYDAFVDGSALPDTAKKLGNDLEIEHSVTGVRQGIVIAWKPEVINNAFLANKAMIDKVVSKVIKVNINFVAAPSVD